MFRYLWQQLKKPFVSLFSMYRPEPIILACDWMDTKPIRFKMPRHNRITEEMPIVEDTTREDNRNFVISIDSPSQSVYVTDESDKKRIVWGKVHPSLAAQYTNMGDAIEYLHSFSKEDSPENWSIRRLSDEEQALIDATVA